MTPKEQFIAGALAIFVAFAPVMIGILRLIGKKIDDMNLDLDEKRQARLKRIAAEQAHVAEEEAARAAKIEASEQQRKDSEAKESAATKATAKAAKVDEETAREAVKLAVSTDPRLGSTSEDKRPRAPLRGGRTGS